jgi:hypothetical protein
MPWWAWLLISVGAFGLGAVVGAGGAMIYVGRGMWG